MLYYTENITKSNFTDYTVILTAKYINQPSLRRIKSYPNQDQIKQIM